MSNEGEKEEGKSFKVEDKRRFTDAGETRSVDDSVSTGGSSQVGDEPNQVQPDTDATISEAAEGHQAHSSELPAINFSTFIISLSTQALMLLGEITDPATGGTQKDVGVAKQTIDIIAMLEEKCRGNLDEHETKLMTEVLYDLRMRYVEAVRQK